MIIKVLLIAAFSLLLWRFLTNPFSSQVRAGKKIVGVIFTLIGIFVIAFPDSSNTVAHVVGVTRGADLLLYLMSIAFIFSGISLYIKEKQDQKRLALLTRKVAILEAIIKKHIEK